MFWLFTPSFGPDWEIKNKMKQTREYTNGYLAYRDTCKCRQAGIQESDISVTRQGYWKGIGAAKRDVDSNYCSVRTNDVDLV